MTERRFTDRDVALILRRAAELDKDSPGDSGARGLSVKDLRDIAAEVGIDPEMVTRAAAELGRQGPRPASILGAPLVNRQIRAVPAELGRDAFGKLIRVVDQTVPAQGTIAEALGSVRWSAPGRFLSRQVSLEPSNEETLIRVEERYADRFRGALHGIPAAYGAVFGFAIGLETIGGILPAVLLALLLATGGWTIARIIWKLVSRRSRRRVDALADELEHEATQLTRGSQRRSLQPSDESHLT